ncbi:hypothetical protein [Paraburkholderia atlantica]|uniref:hypothetical protein n=1 Tax=Paraburkholderia atlantica TaxID=2654982 RepID=UPI0016163568|nr:hypothetical protein [Paraburkholderia atlantica]MBB5508097.1 hypothetical protein [Paraburkholderia atlantica]
MSECQCRACLRGQTVDYGFGTMSADMTRMIVCGKCGNKRCPHATDHRNECTNSNEPGQSGSVYGPIDPEADRDTKTRDMFEEAR